MAAEARADTPERDSWYIGFGFGSGPAQMSFGGESVDYEDVFPNGGSVRVSARFEVGGTLADDLLLGAHLVGMREAQSSLSLQHSQYLAMLTYFPLPDGRGLFVRGGAGFAVAILEAFDREATQGGLGAALGVGYAFWLGESFNLTLSNDLHFAGFGGEEALGEPTSGWFDSLELGFVWY